MKARIVAISLVFVGLGFTAALPSSAQTTSNTSSERTETHDRDWGWLGLLGLAGLAGLIRRRDADQGLARGTR